MLRSHHARSKKRSKKPSNTPTRTESTFGSTSYTDALQRAFNRAKQQIYFNPDMRQFITLTYKGVDHTPEDVVADVRDLVRTERRNSGAKPKYIYVMEYQKRGSIHVHMITDNSFTLQVNKNNHHELVYWQKGFSSVLQITDFDHNFRPYLYLFKYMRKAQRIGKSFLHSSRNLNNFEEISEEQFQHLQWDTVTQERNQTEINGTKLTYYRTYMQKHDTIELQT